MGKSANTDTFVSIKSDLNKISKAAMAIGSIASRYSYPDIGVQLDVSSQTQNVSAGCVDIAAKIFGLEAKIEAMISDHERRAVNILEYHNPKDERLARALSNTHTELAQQLRGLLKP